LKQIIKSIVITGPECSGKSTLANSLSNRLKVPLIHEYARSFLEEKDEQYSYEDLLHIAQEQHRALCLASEESNLQICDTWMYVMKIWCEFKFGRCHKFILDTIAKEAIGGIILCANNFPFESDPLRESKTKRERNVLFTYYLEHIRNQCIPFCIVKGSKEERLQKSLSFIEQL